MSSTAVPRIVTLYLNSDGVPFLADGSPHVYGERGALLAEALRRDMSALVIERASRRFRRIPEDEPQPHPEVCKPYVDANGLGYMLRPRLPILFVRTRQGELLPDARTALAYARANEDEFADPLAEIERHAASVLDPDVVARAGAGERDLFRDLVQPYASFAPRFFSIPAGFYAETPPGIGTRIGPPVNRPSVLPIQTGIIETDWHQRELFVVTAHPDFEGRFMLIRSGADLAQVYFVDRSGTAEAKIVHHESYATAGATYDALWRSTTDRLGAEGRGVLAERSGIHSVTLDCLHCRIAIDEAAEGNLPIDHRSSVRFVPSYKTLRTQLVTRPYHRKEKADERSDRRRSGEDPQ